MFPLQSSNFKMFAFYISVWQGLLVPLMATEAAKTLHSVYSLETQGVDVCVTSCQEGKYLCEMYQIV